MVALSLESVLVLSSLSGLLLSELAITALLLLHDLFALLLSLLLLSLAEKLDVLFLKGFVLTALVHFVNVSILLFLHLLVKLVADQSSALLLSKHGLFLLLVVQQGVELLDSGPLVLLGQLRVNFGASAGLAGGDTHLVGLSTGGTGSDLGRLGASARASHRANRFGISILSSSAGNLGGGASRAD